MDMSTPAAHFLNAPSAIWNLTASNTNLATSLNN